jgi:hypothetical protein
MMKHYTFTLGASATTLAALLATADATDPYGGATGKAVRQLSLQPDVSNSNPIYLGGSNAALTTSNYGLRLEAPVAAIPPAPFLFETAWEAPIRLADVSILGTVSEKVHVLISSI